MYFSIVPSHTEGCDNNIFCHTKTILEHFVCLRWLSFPICDLFPGLQTTSRSLCKVKKLLRSQRRLPAPHSEACRCRNTARNNPTPGVHQLEEGVQPSNSAQESSASSPFLGERNRSRNGKLNRHLFVDWTTCQYWQPGKLKECQTDICVVTPDKKTFGSVQGFGIHTIYCCLIDKFSYDLSQGQMPSPKRMNFQKSSKLPLTPTPPAPQINPFLWKSCACISYYLTLIPTCICNHLWCHQFLKALYPL